ncbi:MAG: hypothetical protein CR996_00020 [Draconibacterium sp.]|nr:MAG: hypothetical protein CR996_00020 [Draconibacterium sp.]
MFWKVVKIIGLILFVTLVAITLSFTLKKQRNVVCQEINVHLSENEVINLDIEKIKSIINKADKTLKNKRLSDIKTNKLEDEIEKNPAILNAEVFTVRLKEKSDFKGVLSVKVKHRRPIVRIMSSGGNYFMDKEGAKIPISTDYTAQVLVVTGFFDKNYATQKLLPLINYIEKSEFWKAQIEQIHIDKQKNIEITPLVGNHFIHLGKIDNFSTKLRNMEAFYKQIMTKNNWNKYKYINLEYKNQVIAKKRAL